LRISVTLTLHVIEESRLSYTADYLPAAARPGGREKSASFAGIDLTDCKLNPAVVSDRKHRVP
jgi:hypothetical protein